MKHSSTLFLQSVIFLIGLIVLYACVVGIPWLVGAPSLSGYDPILLSLYIPAIPFFIALFQATKLLNYIDTNRAFSVLSVKAFRNIKLCAVGIAGFFALAMPYIFYVADKDDSPGALLIGLVIMFASLVIATFAAVLQKLVQNAVDIKAENDLTV
jgi:hypothetical protein